MGVWVLIHKFKMVIFLCLKFVTFNSGKMLDRLNFRAFFTGQCLIYFLKEKILTIAFLHQGKLGP